MGSFVIFVLLLAFLVFLRQDISRARRFGERVFGNDQSGHGDQVSNVYDAPNSTAQDSLELCPGIIIGLITVFFLLISMKNCFTEHLPLPLL